MGAHQHSGIPIQSIMASPAVMPQRNRESRRICSFKRSALKTQYSLWVAATSARQPVGFRPASIKAASASRRTTSNLAGFSAGAHCSASHRATSSASSFGLRAMLEYFGQDGLSLCSRQIVFPGKRAVKQFELGFYRFERDPWGVRGQVLNTAEDSQLLTSRDNLSKVGAMKPSVGLTGCLQDHKLVRSRSKLFDSIEPPGGLSGKCLATFDLIVAPLLGGFPGSIPTFRNRIHIVKMPTRNCAVKARVPQRFST